MCDIRDYLFQTCMSKIRNMGISSLYLADLVNAQHENLKKNYANPAYGPVYIIWSLLRSENKNTDL